MRGENNKYFVNLVLFLLERFLFLLFPQNSIAKVRTQLTLVFSNILFLVVCKKIFLEKMVCLRSMFQKYVKNLQPSFQQCTQYETESAIEVSMLQLGREGQSFLIKTNLIEKPFVLMKLWDFYWKHHDIDLVHG